MATHSMTCHPATPAKLTRGIAIDIIRQQDGSIRIRYDVDAPPVGLKLGKPGKPERRDQLWQTTCFEAFVREAGKVGYLEFNFAPSSAWAAYSFADYRSDMVDLPMASLPELSCDGDQSHFAFIAMFELPPELHDANLLMAVTAVIEERDGTKSYWSLTHPAGAPDFHHPDCFTLRLPARARS